MSSSIRQRVSDIVDDFKNGNRKEALDGFNLIQLRDISRDELRATLQVLIDKGSYAPVLSKFLPRLVLVSLEYGYLDELDLALRYYPPMTLMPLLLSLMQKAAPKYKKALSRLLNEQLQKPTGVRSLLVLIIGLDDELVQLEKLESLATLVLPPDRGDAYYDNIVNQIIAILVSSSPVLFPPYREEKQALPPPPSSILRASVFLVSHLIQNSINLHVLYSILHSAFLLEKYASPAALQPENSLYVITLILLYAPPMPELYDTLIKPIIPSLLHLIVAIHRYEHASEASLDDVGIRPASSTNYFSPTSVNTLLKEQAESTLKLWTVYTLSDGNDEKQKLSIVANCLTNAVDLIERNFEFGSVASDGPLAVREAHYTWYMDDRNLLRALPLDKTMEADMYQHDKVDPDALVPWIESLDRTDLASQLFLTWLTQLDTFMNSSDMSLVQRSLVRLNLVMQMYDKFGENVLKEPLQVLSFIAHAIRLEKSTDEDDNGLNIEEDAFESELGMGQDGLAMTAITLLLAVLEGHPELNMNNTPLLFVINQSLARLASAEDAILIRPLAQEARNVLLLRRLETRLDKTEQAEEKSEYKKSRETYEQVLKVLQDPLLPVRAHGLVMLRDMIEKRDTLLVSDADILPTILDIFVSAIEDEDSYLYLNAIQGLSALVDNYGKPMAQRLIQVYLGHPHGIKDGSSATIIPISTKGDYATKDLDRRLRAGEALIQVVQKAGAALPVVENVIIPPLLLVLRCPELPVPLRASAVTILATCLEASALSLISFIEDIAMACLSIAELELQREDPNKPLKQESKPDIKGKKSLIEEIEPKGKNPNPIFEDISLGGNSLVEEIHPKLKKPLIEEVDDDDNVINDRENTGKEDEKIKKLQEMLNVPTAQAVPKKPEETPDQLTRKTSHPSLRRSALLLLSSLFRTAIDFDSFVTKQQLVPIHVRKRAKIVLGYISDYDYDTIVRGHALTALADLNALSMSDLVISS